MQKLIRLILACFLVFTVCVFTRQAVYAQSLAEGCNADIDQVGTRSGSTYTGSVNLSDYNILVQDFLKSTLANPRSNISRDGQNQVNLSDFDIFRRWFLKSVTCTITSATSTPSPTNPPLQTSSEWNQDAGNAQRTGYTPEEPTGTWTYKWTFNGSDQTGGVGGHLYNAPKEARTVVGTTNGVTRLFVPAGENGLYAFELATGKQVWHITPTSFVAAPSYDPATQKVYIGGINGSVYKIDPQNGSIVGTYSTGSSIRKAALVFGNFTYAVTDDGKLHKITTATMTVAANFPYSAGSPIDTPPSYSASKDIIVFATRDLNVHAVNNQSGSIRWKVKPSPNSPGQGGSGKISVGGQLMGSQFNLGWPVIADGAGIVLLRMQLEHQAHFQGPSWEKQTDGSYRLEDNGKYKKVTSAEIKQYFDSNPRWKNLFALSLENGASVFTPAVGYGSTEDYVDDVGTQGVMGSIPVVKTLSSGKQVAYIHYRSQADGATNDYRWSGAIGEMVLDNSTVPTYVGGDLRFIQLPNSNIHIIDEQEPLAIAGNILFHNHWAGVEIFQILDRSDTKGSSPTNPITSKRLAPIMHALKPCGSFSATTHFTSCSTVQYPTDGGRTFTNVPGAFYSYWGVADPPGWKSSPGNTSTGAGTSYSSGFLPRYTYVSNGYIVTEGNGGDIMVLTYRQL